jgi:hypothetical protein
MKPGLGMETGSRTSVLWGERGRRLPLAPLSHVGLVDLEGHNKNRHLMIHGSDFALDR